MNNELTTINTGFPTQIELQNISLVARTAHASGLYSGVGSEAKIMMVLLAAKELGVSPCLALNGGIWNIQGKIEISARLMNGLIRRAGHSIKIIVSNDTHCTLLGTRTDGDSFETSFTMDDATKAGLSSGNVWKKYPADMLYNRCMSRLARRLFPDVIGTAYVEGEIKEAKELEKLEQAECEDLTQNKTSIPVLKLENKTSTPKIDTNMNRFQTDTNLTQEPKISFDHLTKMMEMYIQTDDTFKENFEKYMHEKWKVKEFEEIPEKYFHASMTAITRNIEMQSMVVNNAG